MKAIWPIVIMVFGVMGCQTSPDPQSPQIGVDETELTFHVAGDTLPCQGMVPMMCLQVNGDLFYDTIDGYAHQNGRPRSLRVARRQRCDPKVPNDCPMDVGIYAYRLIKVLE